jgi:hypothetical protein
MKKLLIGFLLLIATSAQAVDWRMVLAGDGATTTPASLHLLVDFGNPANGGTTTSATGWNNLTYDLTTHNPLVDSVGSATSATLIFTVHVSTPPFATNTAGSTSSSIYPLSATVDSLFVDKSVGNYPQTFSFNLEGLNPALTYTFKFYGARASGGNRTTDYTIAGTTVSLNAANNNDNTVSNASVTPNGSGIVTVTVTPNASSDEYGYLNVLEITSN